MLRWYFNIAKWQPSPDTFSQCVDNLPSDEEKQSILRFVKLEDKKRAFISRLLQRVAIRRICKCQDADVRIQRTKGKKPFCLNSKPQDAPNFNYNVSHEVRHVIGMTDDDAVMSSVFTWSHKLKT